MNAEVQAISAELAAELSHPIAPAGSVLDLPNGFHTGIPEDWYHQRQLGVASKGALDKILDCPAVYKAWLDARGDEDAETKALGFGKTAHAFVLEPSVFARTYVAEPDFGYCMKHDASGTTKEQGAENKRRRDAWRAEHVGARIVSAKDLAVAEGARRSLLADPDIGPHLRALWDGKPGYHAEATIRWECPVSGLICKARPDLYIDGGALLDQSIMIDLKFMADCRESAFDRSRIEYGYHRQDAHYRTGAREVGRPIERFLFPVVEKSPPFLMQVYEMDADLLAFGEEQNEAAKLRLATCAVFDEWPGLESGIKTLRRKPWEK